MAKIDIPVFAIAGNVKDIPKSLLNIFKMGGLGSSLLATIDPNELDKLKKEWDNIVVGNSANKGNDLLIPVESQILSSIQNSHIRHKTWEDFSHWEGVDNVTNIYGEVLTEIKKDLDLS